MDVSAIRFRLAALRERSKMSQAELAEALGFKDRQTLSQIETGERRLGAEEMIAASRVFGVGIDYFTDPFELAGEGRFSWRQVNADPAALDGFERTAGNWIAAFRHLSKLRGDSINSSMRRVGLTKWSSFEDAVAEGEIIGAALGLGDVPSIAIAEALQTKLDTLVLYVDAVRGVSGAACQLEQLNAVLINRREPAARRAYDLAHELFHLLTWAEMPPRRIESENPQDKAERRVEQLAENFAAGLLMPSKTVAALLAASSPPKGFALPSWLRESAAKLGVSGSALKWRLVNYGALKLNEAQGIADESIRASSDASLTPPKFGRRFAEVMAWGIENGHVSVRRLALLLGTTVDELLEIFAENGVDAPFDL